MFQNFTPLFELAVALNLAYASLPQLGRSIRLSVSQKLNSQINKLKAKTGDAQIKLTTISESSVGEPEKEALIVTLKAEEAQTDNILKNVDTDVDIANNRISNRMNLYFFSASIISVVFLYLIGITETDLETKIDIFPLKSLLYTYLIFLITLPIIAGWKYFNGDFYKKGFIGIVSTAFFLTSMSYGSDLCIYLATLKYSDILLLNIMLTTTALPLLSTIPQYIYTSKNISKRYSEMISKQALDVNDLITSIDDAATSKKSVDTIHKVTNATKKP